VKWQGRDKRLRMYVGDVLRYVGVVAAVSEEERVELRRYKKITHLLSSLVLLLNNIYIVLFIKNRILFLI
jgi:hypothetical protein